MRVRLTLSSRTGSTTVLALMVSLLLMVLLTATIALTMVDVEMVQDYARNKKTFQAADSGVVHANVTLAHALSGFALPANTSKTDVDAYADDAEGGLREEDRDISLLVDTGQHITEVLPREYPTTYGTTEYSEDGLYVSYGASVDISPSSVDRPESGDISHTHLFHYQYAISSQGAAAIGGQYNQATRVERGSFDVEVKRPSFATYGYFGHTSQNQFDHQLWFFDGEVYGGPTHVNTPPPDGRLAFWGQPTFNGPFSAVQSTYEESIFGGGADPIFNDTATFGVEPIDLPENGWSQFRAAVGDYANVDNPALPGNSELRELLELTPGEDPVDQGVYYAGNYNESGSLLGGILVYGTADSISLEASGNEQIITITMAIDDGGEFDGYHTWELHDNVVSGSSYVLLDGETQASFNESLNGVIHVEGELQDLSGEGTLAGPDVEAHHGLTVSSSEDIYISDHLTYAVDPTENPSAVNILGIFSANGNIYLAREAPNDLTVHATVMATGEDNGVGAEGIVSGGWYDYNYPFKGDWNLLGGLIENRDQTTGVFYSDGHITGYLWDFDYDERFLEGVAPPYFPYVTKFIIVMKGIEPGSWGRKYF